MSSTFAGASSAYVSLVSPAFEELENLRRLVPEIRGALDSLHLSGFEVVVVLPSHAGDDEKQEIEGLGARVVTREPTDSFGDALRTGFASVSPEADLVVTMDADGSHDPSSLPGLISAMEDSTDVVIASRYTAGGQTDNPFLLKLMSRALNRAYGLILGIDCSDISTNFKVYRREDLQQLSLSCVDFDVVEEILFRIQQLHGTDFEVVEVPDHFYERQHGVTKRRLGPFTVSYLLTLVRLRRSSGTGPA